MSAEKRSINDKPVEYRELIVETITEEEDNMTENDELEKIREFFNLMKYYIEKL